MQDFEELKKAKQRCVDELVEALPRYRERLDEIDHRLVEYIEDALSNNASHCNIYEAMGIRKEFRLMDSYKMDVARVHRTLRAIEGVWQGGRHQKGGLKFDTPRGNRHVQLMSYQTWCVFGIYAFTVDADMEREDNGSELLPTEFVVDGHVYDRRRLCEEADIFQTRKSGKTEFGASIDFTETCFLGPVNAQTFICSPSKEISKTAYKAIKEFAMQIDPTCSNRMGGKYFRLTASEMNWQPGHRMKGEIRCMAAGKTPKDSLYAYIVHADEHGQPGYINGHCDMQSAVETCWGSTGPRRERLLLHTTTAGLNMEGPYRNHLKQVENMLLKELEYPLGEPHRTDNDYHFAFLLQLDPWEQGYDLDQLDDTELFKKVNRSIGITVQPDYYRKRLNEARKSDDTRKEVLTKDFNIWQTGRITEWIRGDRIRPLQIARRVTDCRYQDGWRVFCGLDFSHGDDLFAMTYLCVDYKRSETPEGHLFADCDAWVLEETMKDSPNRPLYEQWVKAGWLHVCPGEVFDSMLAMNRLGELVQSGVDIVTFGFDPAQNRSPINQLKAWLQTLFQQRNQGVSVKELDEVIKRMVVPVSQTAMTMNPIIGHVEDLVKDPARILLFSENPMWPWQFGNCACEISSSNLRRIIKGGPIASHKIDCVFGLLDAMWAFDLSEGQVSE